MKIFDRSFTDTTVPPKMARKTEVFNELEENFCQCLLCLEQYDDPKQLPCLHRYCKKCLQQLLQTCNTIIKCPECRKEFAPPTEGVDGFPTDFYMQKLIEYIEVKKLLQKRETIQICYGCSQETKISAYCAKCRNFLCSDCHNYHTSSNLFNDHKPHTMGINDPKIQTICTNRLELPNDPPRCLIHRENVTQLCCRTCENLPICVTCTYGEHKKHDINDVITLANAERERLEKEMWPLYKAKENSEKVTTSLVSIKQDISSFVAEKTNSLQLQYEEELAKIEGERKHLKQESESDETFIKDTLDLCCNKLLEKMEEELQKVRDRFENLLSKEKKEAQQRLQNMQKKFQIKDTVLVEESKLLGKRLKEAVFSLETEEHRKAEETERILQHYNGATKGFENLVATASGILKSQCNWTAVQCIPDVRKAIQPLIEDMNKRFLNVNRLSHISSDLTLKSHDDLMLLRNVRGNAWNINCITSTKNSNVVICGSASESSTHITVIDGDGNTLRQQQFKATKRRTSIWRFCCPLQNYKVATVCWPAEIGIFDTRNGSYSSKNITDITCTWPKNQVVWSLASDDTRECLVLSGHKSNVVYVFDYRLKYCCNFTLPRCVHWPRDITISRGKLIVCDLSGQSAYVVDMKGNFVYQFCKINYNGIIWKPYNVCTDKNGFVWMLFSSGSGSSILVKYCKSGQVPQVVHRIDDSAECVTAHETTESSLILVASYTKGIIFKFRNEA